MAAVGIKILTLSVVATAALSANRAVTGTGAVPAAGARCLGVTDFAAAIGERVSVGVQGTMPGEAGAAFAADAALELDAVGRFITKASGVTVGRAITAAVGAGSLAEILLIPN
ncbi:capsid cement protein [Duganella sp. CT11-25]|uniref:capsid cement protein n=1 Tax=unclassified Duganella TaxID=2636909 RepID=UPI0039B12894